ncbi:MAG: hypothetical protein ACRDBH_11190 [Bosea sp. (in: a-proteobacteria)]
MALCLGCGLTRIDTGGGINALAIAEGVHCAVGGASQPVYCTNGSLVTDAMGYYGTVTPLVSEDAAADAQQSLTSIGQSHIQTFNSASTTDAAQLCLPKNDDPCRSATYEVYVDFEGQVTHKPQSASGVTTVNITYQRRFIGGAWLPIFDDYSQNTGTRISRHHEHFVLSLEQAPGATERCIEFGVKYEVPFGGVVEGDAINIEAVKVRASTRKMLFPSCA